MSHRGTDRRPRDLQRSGQRSQSASVSRVLDPNAPAFVPAAARPPRPGPPPLPTQQQFQGPFQNHGQMPMGQPQYPPLMGQPQYPPQMGHPQYPAQMGQQVRYMPMNLARGAPPILPQQPGHFPHPQMAPPNMLPMRHPGMFQPFTRPYVPPGRGIQRQDPSGVPQQRQQSVPPPRRQFRKTQRQPSMNANVSLYAPSNVPQSHPQSNVTFGGFGGTNIENQTFADEPELDFNEIVKRIHENTPLPAKLTNNSDEMWSLVRKMAKIVIETRHEDDRNEVLVAKTADSGENKLESSSTQKQEPSSSAALMVSSEKKSEDATVQMTEEIKSASLSVTDGFPSTSSLSAPVQSSKLSKGGSAKTTEKVILEQRISEKPSTVIPPSKAKNVDTKSEAGKNNNGSAPTKQPTFNEVVQAKFSKYCSSMPKFRNNYEDSNIELFNKITEHVYWENLTESQDINGIIENFSLRMDYYNDRGDPEKRNMHLMLEQFIHLAMHGKTPIIRQDMMFLFGVKRDEQEQAKVEMSYRDMILSMPDEAADTKGSGVDTTGEATVVLDTVGTPNALLPPSKSAEVEQQTNTAENSMLEQSISKQLEVSTVSEARKTKSGGIKSGSAKKNSEKKGKAKSANNSKQTEDDFDLDEYNNQQAAFDDMFFAKLVPYFLMMYDARVGRIIPNKVVSELFDKITDYVWTNNLICVSEDNIESIEEVMYRRNESYGDKGDTESLGMMSMLTNLNEFASVNLIAQDLMFLFGVRRDKREQGKIEKEYRDMVLQMPIEEVEDVADVDSNPVEHPDSSKVKQHGEKHSAIANQSKLKQPKSAGYAEEKAEQMEHLEFLRRQFTNYRNWYSEHRNGKTYQENPTHKLFHKISDYAWEQGLMVKCKTDQLSVPFLRRFSFYSQQKTLELRKMYNMFMLSAVMIWGNYSIPFIDQDMNYLFGIPRSDEEQAKLETAYFDMIMNLVPPVVVTLPTPPPGFPPKSQGVPSKPEGVPPKPQGVLPKSQGVSPNPQGVSPNPQGVSPKPEGVSPKPPGNPPKSKGISPKPQGFPPKSQGDPPK